MADMISIPTLFALQLGAADWVSNVRTGILDLLALHSGLFEAHGLALFRLLAPGVLALSGIQTALGGGERRSGDTFALLFKIALCLTMLQYYTAALPGVGLSFSEILPAEGLFLARQLDAQTVEEVERQIAGLSLAFERPTGIISALAIHVLFAILQLTVVAMAAAVFFVVVIGKAFVAILLLLGPLFIPFLIVPGFERLFWGWLWSLWQYSFYDVVAQAYVLVFGTALNRFLGNYIYGPAGSRTLAIEEWMALFLPMMAVFVSFILGAALIPSFVRSLFNGQSGEGLQVRLRR